MSNVVSFGPASDPSDEQRLQAFGLSTPLFHTALTPGTSRARGRTSLALATTPGSDIYNDTMEELALILSPQGWRPVNVEGQPRLLHPESLMSFTIASAKNVAHPDPRKSPRTQKKGPATRNALAPKSQQVLSLFDLPESAENSARVDVAKAAPFWMLLHERTPTGLNLEFARPYDMTPSGIVTDFTESIAVAALNVDGDLSVFNSPDSDEDFDVPVERL